MKNKQKINNYQWIIWITFALISSTCTNTSTDKAHSSQDIGELPFFGEPDVEFNNNAEGTMQADTIYYTIPKFSFINQDSAEVSHHTYAGKIFVAEFFFTTCPSICPMLSAQMARIQDTLKADGIYGKVMLLSHTVDPLKDTPSVLKAYADNLHADYTNWNFVTGRPEDIYYQAEDGYMLTAFPSDTAAGGIFHTDKLTLIDWEMHIRGYYDGTSSTSVNQLIKDIRKLVKEQAASTTQ